MKPGNCECFSKESAYFPFPKLHKSSPNPPPFPLYSNKTNFATFQASTLEQLTPSLFWDVTRCMLIFGYPLTTNKLCVKSQKSECLKIHFILWPLVHRNLTSVFFVSFLTKSFWAFLFFPYVPHVPSISFALIFITWKYPARIKVKHLSLSLLLSSHTPQHPIGEHPQLISSINMTDQILHPTKHGKNV